MTAIRGKRRIWKQMNKAMQQIQDEYAMRLNGDGVYIKGVDPAHVAIRQPMKGFL